MNNNCKVKRLLYFVFISIFSLSACNMYEEDFTEIRTEIAQIKASISALEDAYNSGKIISKVTALNSETPESWLITFSDNSTITITSGQDGVDGKDGKDGKDGTNGVTPYLKINEDNVWCISYDGGLTYEIILDNNGNPIPATGKNGEDGIDGKDGKDGEDGKNGKDGNSVRVVVNNDGYYVIEVYEQSTDVVISSITTKYSSNPNSAIKSIVEDKTNNTISITMESGDVFTFRQMLIYPSSIVIIDNEICLSHGGTGTIEFRVNPSNAVFNITDFQLDLIRTKTKAEVSYITTPDSYSIKSIERAIDKNGNDKRGQYIMTIKDNETNPDYNDQITIVISTNDSQGNPMEISSELISVKSTYPSSLARVYINTPNEVGITSKTTWLKDCSIRIINEDGEEDLNVTTSIRGRGNSTWTYPKKPYAIKLDSKEEVLGMPKHKRWVLLANWMDRTLLRNDIAFEMGRRVMSWAPRGEFVEVYLNGKHQGCYYLCEHIKVDKNRVNVDELDEDSDFTDESQVTGGYILEFDTYGPSDEINYFYTRIKNYPVTIKEPDEDVITSWDHLGYSYIQGYVNNIEQLLEDDKDNLTRWDEVEKLIDVNSYIDWWMIHELAYNREPLHPKSSYMYKKRDDKLYAGPVWDFDYGTFVIPNNNTIDLTSTLWYGYLFKYPEFRAAVKTRWTELKTTFEGINQYIVSQATKIRVSNEVNITKWPISLSVNGDESLPYDEAISRISSAYNQRIGIIDTYISNL